MYISSHNNIQLLFLYQISNVSIESNPPLPPPIIFSRKVTPLSSNPDSSLIHARKLITMFVACGIFHVDTILPTHKNSLLQTPIHPTSSISSSHQSLQNCFDGNGSDDHNHNSTNISQVHVYNYSTIPACFQILNNSWKSTESNPGLPLVTYIVGLKFNPTITSTPNKHGKLLHMSLIYLCKKCHLYTDTCIVSHIHNDKNQSSQPNLQPATSNNTCTSSIPSPIQPTSSNRTTKRKLDFCTSTKNPTKRLRKKSFGLYMCL